MCERPKIHAFLGAPPPSPDDDGGTRRERPPCRRRLELTWREGRLVAAADEEEEGIQEDKRSHKESSASTSHRSAESPQRSQDQRVVPLHQDSHFPADRPEAQLSLLSRYLSTWTPSRGLILRGVGSIRCGPETPPRHAQTSPTCSSGTPELFSPPTCSADGSDELFSALRHSSDVSGKLNSRASLSPEGSGGPSRVARQVEQGGVVLEATAHGVLCSQEADDHISWPGSKRARLCEAVGCDADGPDADAGDVDGTGEDRYRSSTTLLVQCTEATTRYRVLVAVVHPCQLKEIKVKRGPSAGSLVPLASLVVTDQSGVDMTVLLWRRAAFWAAAVGAGDVVFITGLQPSEDTWREEKILQSTFSSKLLNLGHISAPSCPPGGQHVAAGSVSALCDFLGARRPLLSSTPRRPPQDLRRLPYAPLWQCRVNTLVHALLRVKHAYISKEWRAEAESCRRSALEPHAVASVEGTGGQRGALLLWGSALDWLPRFRTHQDAVWDVRFLLVREGSNTDLPELHTTPWSAARRADGADRRLSGFLRPSGSGVEMDVDTLLSQQYSGDKLTVLVLVLFLTNGHLYIAYVFGPVASDLSRLIWGERRGYGLDWTGRQPIAGYIQRDDKLVVCQCRARKSRLLSGDALLRVQVLTFRFQPSHDAPQASLDRASPRSAILAALSGDVTYSGCGRCSAELDADGNGIYGPCYPCLPASAVRRYYRPAVLTVSGQGAVRVCVQVPAVAVQKILDVPPDRLLRNAGSDVKYVQVAAERLHDLLRLPGKSVVIAVRSLFLCDENSAPVSQELTLLDLRVPPDT
ncbi:shieldin complex subunit 2 isoform X3 [Phyllopteryx taeniolatus]|uniref:shieldin complex subunit 2 isoform X3 n=1 Tax=Phyllopteryx taeniolatus TaxID=161469 RepID=UPI002AD2AB3A|nr:shieldin complex subunit 2 isoform X3 [Phyllopteryx taeniolatus]